LQYLVSNKISQCPQSVVVIFGEFEFIVIYEIADVNFQLID